MSPNANPKAAWTTPPKPVGVDAPTYGCAIDSSCSRSSYGCAWNHGEQGQAERTEGQIVQGRREPIGRERDRASVRGPHGLQVGVGVERQLPQPLRGGRELEEVAQAALQRGEDEARAVRRPA